MQNSLERLFEGLATSLRDTVAPNVSDPYARSQVLAAVELINNIATRVVWAADDGAEDRTAREQLDAELARLRTGMYRKSS